MARDSAFEQLKLLADENRWRLLAHLRRGDYQVGELVQSLGIAQNLVSYHLGHLRQHGLVRMHRSDADGRAIYYSLELAALQRLYQQIGSALHLQDSPLRELPPLSVVFLCRANSARSQMAEALLRHLGGESLQVASAGTQPKEVHPLAIEVMAERGITLDTQRSKRIDELETTSPDLVVTVCDIAREECAHWNRPTPSIHWSVSDPAAQTGSADERRQAFRQARSEIEQRVQSLLHLLPELSLTAT